MQGEKISRQAWGAVEWLLQSRAATVRGASMAGTVSGGAPRAPRRGVTGCRQQAPTARRGPERLCGGLPVGRAPVPVIAPGLQRGRAVGNREAGIAQPTGGRCAVRQAGGEQRGDED
jgi:hypothetical protein